MRRNEAANPEDVVMPNVRITGQHYEVKGEKALLSNLIGYLRLVCFALMFLGDQIFSALGGIDRMPSAVKDFYSYIKENKMQFGLMVFFLGSMVQAQLMQSGAFEIYVNGNLEFSKLESKKMPTFDEVAVILRNYNLVF